MIVVINDLYDRSPDTWICDTNKLDLKEQIQAIYHAAVMKAVGKCSFKKKDYHQGSADILLFGRPDEVYHARVLPPCKIDNIICLYYQE